VTNDPPKPYSEAETAYVRHRIATGEFDDRETRQEVNDFLRLEEFVTAPPTGFGGGVYYGRLRNKHPDAYDAIQAELDPDAFRSRRRRERENREAQLEHELERRARRRQEAAERNEKRNEREWQSVAADREAVTDE
jgi:hypothetical protein